MTKNININLKDYCDDLEQMMKWPNWKKESANDMLPGHYSKRLPLYIDGDSEIKELDIMMLVDASFEYLDLDDENYDATEEIIPFPLVKTNGLK